MKHVGVNVAADPLFTVAYTGVTGGLVIISADDPGMASSQNEQDNRHYAHAAGVIMLEPADSQEAYDLTIAGFELSEQFNSPVMLRMTTRICHSQTVVRRRKATPPSAQPHFERDVKARVMIPAFARPAHRRLRERLDRVREFNETSDLNRVISGETSLGIVTSGVTFTHAREAAPSASFLKLTLTHPLPMDAVRRFADSVERCMVIEEGDAYLADACRAAGIDVEDKPEMYRFGELNVARVRRILAGDTTPETPPAPGKPPRLCPGCPHRKVFETLRDLGCIVTGDIGCYTLGVLPPFNAMDTCVCMGASIGVGLGLRHALPDDEARRVVSVIGDSTFVHSGITGLAEMVYNPPPTGHVVMILDNGTTAMTGMQEHPGTGRTLSHAPTTQVVFEDLAKSLGIDNVRVVDPVKEADELGAIVEEALNSGELWLIITRRPCVLAAKRIREYELAAGRSETQ